MGYGSLFVSYGGIMSDLVIISSMVDRLSWKWLVIYLRV